MSDSPKDPGSAETTEPDEMDQMRKEIARLDEQIAKIQEALNRYAPAT